ncbi:zinc finger protein 782 [Solenopsis invicta]|uniref:zinc finger protein 782 n=1 Tax=Solenopsis invicta TaxID=13686 RepID=UPI000595EE1F|nr:zinc finger protein 782 [Solenopsis invicta]
MSRNNESGMSLATSPAIHVGPIVTPGSNETISIVIPLSAQLTTMASQKVDKNYKDSVKDPKRPIATGPIPPRRNERTKGCPFLMCPRYGRSFSRAHDLKRHIARHTMRMEKLQQNNQSKVNIKVENTESDATLRGNLLHDTEDKGGQYSCPRCKKRYNDENKFKAHLASHNKATSKNNHLKNMDHTKKSSTKNSGEDEFFLEEMLLLKKDPLRLPHEDDMNKNNSKNDGKIKCDYCSKTFKTKWTLSSHVAAHEGRFQFDCGQCGKKFVRKSHYEGHVRSHEAARPYACECGKTFKELKHRREHARRKHPSNQNAIQSLLDSIGSCTTEETNNDQTKSSFTLLMPAHVNYGA